MSTARVISLPFQTTATPERRKRPAENDAYRVLFENLHPSRESTLTIEQQFEVLDMAGGWGWDNVINASDSTVLAMADRVTEFLAEAH